MKFDGDIDEFAVGESGFVEWCEDRREPVLDCGKLLFLSDGEIFDGGGEVFVGRV